MASTTPSSKSKSDAAPAGTWALLVLVALGMTAAWLFLYFGVFLPRGVVH